MRFFLIIFFVLFFCGNSCSQNTPENSPGSWLMYFGTHSINPKWSIHSELQIRLFEPYAIFNQLLPRVGLNYHITKNSMLTAGYAWIPTQVDFDGAFNNLSIENRIWQQFILKNKVKRFNFEHRYRLEQRWVSRDNFTDYLNRVRYRLLLTIPINHSELKDQTFFLSFYDEIFLNITDSPFDQNRLYAALGYKFNSSISLQVGYLRHRLGNQKLNRFQLGVFLNTKRKVKEKIKMNS